MAANVKVGDTVYWLSSDKSRICSGPVLLASDNNAPGGSPAAIVVGFDGEFHVRRACNAWDDWYPSAQEAYLAGFAHHAKVSKDANAAMVSLVGTLAPSAPDV